MHLPTAMGKAAQKAFSVCTGCTACDGGLAMKDTKVSSWLSWGVSRDLDGPRSGPSLPPTWQLGTRPFSCRFFRGDPSSKACGRPLRHPQLQLRARGSCGCGGGPVAPAAAGEEQPEPFQRSSRRRDAVARGGEGSASLAVGPAVPQVSFVPLPSPSIPCSRRRDGSRGGNWEQAWQAGGCSRAYLAPFRG